MAPGLELLSTLWASLALAPLPRVQVSGPGVEPGSYLEVGATRAERALEGQLWRTLISPPGSIDEPNPEDREPICEHV